MLQYFTGNFDGKTFTAADTDIRWLDYGPDEYAGITWSNTGERKVFLGWMSNWQYANVVPTKRWRSAMTIPRDLGLEKVGEKYFLTSIPAPELEKLEYDSFKTATSSTPIFDLSTTKMRQLNGAAALKFNSPKIKDFQIELSNSKNEKVIIGFDEKNNQYFIDRTNAGNIAFEKGFAARHTAPRISPLNNMDVTLVIDVASVELFADKGLTAMTSIFFPSEPFTNLKLISNAGFVAHDLHFSKMKSIW